MAWHKMAQNGTLFGGFAIYLIIAQTEANRSEGFKAEAAGEKRA
jgi:hypothetical protein